MSAPKNEKKILKIFEGTVDEEELEDDILSDEIDEVANDLGEEIKITVKKKQEFLDNKFKKNDKNKDKRNLNEKE
jgi:hypothetical protein